MSPQGEPECWIGARASTSIDSFFQPFYIGAVAANDRKILLGDLFAFDADATSWLQYVYDFGDWWSHTIALSEAPSPPPAGTTVAYLESGVSSCPPEDSGAIGQYSSKLHKLSGLSTINSEDFYDQHTESEKSVFVGPSQALWWKLLNSEVRGKSNTVSLREPFEFHIEKTSFGSG